MAEIAPFQLGGSYALSFRFTLSFLPLRSRLSRQPQKIPDGRMIPPGDSGFNPFLTCS